MLPSNAGIVCAGCWCGRRPRPLTGLASALTQGYGGERLPESVPEWTSDPARTNTQQVRKYLRGFVARRQQGRPLPDRIVNILPRILFARSAADSPASWAGRSRFLVKTVPRDP